MLVSPLATLFSTDALHMAHCAKEVTEAAKNNKVNKETLINDFITNST